MKHLRRSLIVVMGVAATLLAWAGVAAAQAYPPPPPGPQPGPDIVNVQPGGGGNLAFTGSDLTLLWVGLAALVVGVVLFVATRRRASMRRLAQAA